VLAEPDRTAIEHDARKIETGHCHHHSTNAVLHLLAVAREAGVALGIDEFDRISRKTPLLADLRPWGHYTAPEMYEAGGMGVVAHRLLDAKVINAAAMTVTGSRWEQLPG